MTNKMKLYIVLLVVGIVLVVTGIVLAILPGRDKVEIPQGNPVVYEKLAYLMRGQFDYLYIYDDGSIIYIEEEGLRMPSPERPSTRTWRTGKLNQEQLDSLLAYLGNSGLDELEEYYNFPGEPIENGPADGFTRGDMDFTVTVISDVLSKSVTASGYLTPDKGETYPDMPSPLNDVYTRLRAIAVTTQEVYQENISP